MSEPTRRASFGMLLRRSKSSELKGSKKQRELDSQRQRDQVPKSPPRLPVLYNGAQPLLPTYTSDDTMQGQTSLDSARPDSMTIGTDYRQQQYRQSQQQHRNFHYPRPPQSQQTYHDSAYTHGPRDTSDRYSEYTTASYGRNSTEPGRPSISSINYQPPAVPNFDPYSRTESMAHRGRYSYASSAVSSINNPRRVRRRKDPTPFNVLIMGTRGSGKTSFLEFLKKALAPPPKKRSQRNTGIGEEPSANNASPTGNFIPQYLETEIDGERIGLTLWDSEGLEKNLVDLQLREMTAFLESKFEETFNEEMKVIRSPGVQDTHIHAVFLILDPARLDRNIAASKSTSAMLNGNGHNGLSKDHGPRALGGLDEDLDLQVMRALQGRTTVIPVISKADTITTAHMAVLKRTVWHSLKKAQIDPLEALGLEDDDSPDASKIDEADEEERGFEDADKSSNADYSDDGENPTMPSQSSPTRSPTKEESDELPTLPMSIISPDLYEPDVIGRKFPWGFADPYNEEHCDFTRLKDAVFSEWRGDLREASRDQWYEGWRTSRLKNRESGYRRR